MSNEYIHVKKVIDGRCIDLLFTEDEFIEASSRAIDVKNAHQLEDITGQCWPVDKPPKCSLWDRIMGRCCQCDN